MSRNLKRVLVGGDVMQVFFGLTAIVLAQALLHDSLELAILAILCALSIIVVRLAPKQRHAVLDEAASADPLGNTAKWKQPASRSRSKAPGPESQSSNESRVADGKTIRQEVGPMQQLQDQQYVTS
jgi:hypothetical protein